MPKLPAPSEDPTSIGNILIEMGACTQNDVDRAVAWCKENMVMGSVLVRLGTVSQDQVDEALQRQRVARGQASRQEMSSFRRRLVGELKSETQQAATATKEMMMHLSRR